MQDKYIDKSVEFSSAVQKQFVSYGGRTDHGVRQAGFWVLHRSACPSVLVEVGFISNAAEERFLMSEQGQKQMATAIYNAFVDYKRGHDKKSGRQGPVVSKIEPQAQNVEPQPTRTTPKVTEAPKGDDQETVRKPRVTEAPVQKPAESSKSSNVSKQTSVVATDQENEGNVVFKVQLFASRVELGKDALDFKGVQGIELFTENRYFKYILGAETDYAKIEKVRRSILSKFPDAFIIAFQGDRKLAAKEISKLTK